MTNRFRAVADPATKLLEEEVESLNKTIEVLTSELENALRDKEQFREDNKTLLGIIDELNDNPPWEE